MKELKGKKFWIVLLLAFATFIFTGGSYNVDIIALLSPVFALMITRNTSRARDFLLLAALMGLAGIIKFPDFVDKGIPYDQLVSFTATAIIIVPYIIDRFVYRNFTKKGSLKRKFAATFIFPILNALLEQFCNVTSFGTVYAMSLTQNDILPFMQVASIVGQFGLAFIVLWIPSFIYFLFDVMANMEKKNLSDFIRKVKVPVAIFTLVFVAIFAFGELRLAFSNLTNNYVKVAYAHGVRQYKNNDGIWVTEKLDKLKKAFSEQTSIAAKNGAKLLCFNEEAFFLYKDNLDNFLDYVSKETKANKIYTLVGIESKDPANEELSKNMAVLVDPEGNIISQYNKSRLIPFVETADYEPGDSRVPVMALQLLPNVTSIVSTAICFEGEFSSYINQVGPETDIHLNPSMEWIDYTEFHNKALQLRAIEHGMSVVEPTTDNTSAIFDCLGRIVSTSSTDGTGYNEVTFGSVPAEGIFTLYILGGYVLDYLYLPGLIVFVILAILRWRECKYCEEEKTEENKDVVVE